MKSLAERVRERLKFDQKNLLFSWKGVINRLRTASYSFSMGAQQERARTQELEEALVACVKSLTLIRDRKNDTTGALLAYEIDVEADRALAAVEKALEGK